MEGRGAVAFAVPCCRGLWDLTSSGVASSSAELGLEESAWVQHKAEQTSLAQ